MNASRSKPITTGGKIAPTSLSARNFAAIEFAILKLESKYQQAHAAVSDRTSVDSDFLSDDEIKQALESIRQQVLAAIASLQAQSIKHRAHRGIHANRQMSETIKRNLAAAEAKYL